MQNNSPPVAWTDDYVPARADQMAIELILSTLLAGAAMQNPKMLDRMHEALSDRLVDTVRAMDAPSALTGRIEVSALAALDRILGGAKAMH